MFGETTISYIKIWNHPIKTTIYKQTFQVPGWYYFFLKYHLYSSIVSLYEFDVSGGWWNWWNIDTYSTCILFSIKSYLGCGPLPVTVANERFIGIPDPKNVMSSWWWLASCEGATHKSNHTQSSQRKTVAGWGSHESNDPTTGQFAPSKRVKTHCPHCPAEGFQFSTLTRLGVLIQKRKGWKTLLPTNQHKDQNFYKKGRNLETLNHHWYQITGNVCIHGFFHNEICGFTSFRSWRVFEGVEFNADFCREFFERHVRYQ